MSSNKQSGFLSWLFGAGEPNFHLGLAEHVVFYAATALRDIAHDLSNRVSTESYAGCLSFTAAQVAHIRLANTIGGILHHSDKENLIKNRVGGHSPDCAEFTRLLAQLDPGDFAKARDGFLERPNAVSAMIFLSDVLRAVTNAPAIPSTSPRNNAD